MDELQKKIEEVEIETLRMAFVKEKLVQEAKIGIQQVEVARALEGGVHKLRSEDSMNDKNI